MVRLKQVQLAKWDDFRQADWSEIVDNPNLIYITNSCQLFKLIVVAVALE